MWKNNLYWCKILMLTILLIVILICVALSGSGCAQGILNIKYPVELSDDKVVMCHSTVKVNTFMKDIKWGDYESSSNRLKFIYPPFYLDTTE